MLTVYYGSTATLTATLRNLAGAAVTGATVTVTIVRSDDGVVLVTAASMADAGAGAYTYTIASNLLTQEGCIYKATISAVKSGETRSAMVHVLLAYDQD